MTPVTMLVFFTLAACVTVISHAITRAATRLAGQADDELKHFKSVRTVPLLSWSSWRAALEVLRSPGRVHALTADMCRRYSRNLYSCGDESAPFALWVPGWRRRLVVLSSPSALEDVLRREFASFPKGEYQCENMRDLLGNGIFAVDGGRWRRQRKAASRLFTARALRESMSAVVRRHASTLSRELGRYADQEDEGMALSGSTVDLFELLSRFTFDVFAEIGFGIETDSLTVSEAGDEEEGSKQEKTAARKFQRAFDSAQRTIAQRFIRPAWLWKTQRWLSVGIEAQLKRDLRVIDATSATMVDKCVAKAKSEEVGTSESVSKPVTIVSLLLNDRQHSDATQDDHESLMKELRDAVVNFMLAGRDTTAQALTWFFYCLMRNSRVEAKLREELQGIHTDADSASLVYLEAALRETLRLYPPVPFTTKDASRDVILSDGTPIRAGTTVGLTFFAMGRDPRVWGEDAAEFKPERWLETSSDCQRPKIASVTSFKFIAFNAGPRTCLGANLAILELKTVAATLLRAFRFELVPQPGVCIGNMGVEPDLALTLPPRGGLRVRVRRSGC